MLFCCQEGKWGKVPDVNLFFALQNNDKAWKECGLMAADTHVLALEKEKGSIMKRIKYRKERKEKKGKEIRKGMINLVDGCDSWKGRR